MEKKKKTLQTILRDLFLTYFLIFQKIGMEEVRFVKYCCYFKAILPNPTKATAGSACGLSAYITLLVKGDVKTLHSSPKMHREEPLNNRMCVLLKSKELLYTQRGSHVNGVSASRSPEGRVESCPDQSSR